MKWLVLLALTGTASADPGWFAAIGGGANTQHPFGEARLGRRFDAIEGALIYSYDAAISELPFQMFGVGMRAYFAHRAGLELYLEATASLGFSGSGRYGDRAIGDRLLGAILTDGIGASYPIDGCWSVDVTVSTGTPIWLRGALAVRRAW